jgi:DNA repair photolyase
MEYVNRKSMIIRESGRSSDFITPSFGYGCLYKCTYCYMRRHVKNGVTIASNTHEILDALDRHLWLIQMHILLYA